MARYELQTKRGYVLMDVVSALQKSVRRGDAALAGYFAIEMVESGYVEYCWRRLLTISAEDCWGLITFEIEALYNAWKVAKGNKKGVSAGRIFIAKATILLAMARKSRDADHLTNLVYDPNVLESEVKKALNEPRLENLPVPDYAYDVHTKRGRLSGKTKKDFFIDEHGALCPRQPGLFDHLIDEMERDD